MPCAPVSGIGGPQGGFGLSSPPFPVSFAVHRSSPGTLGDLEDSETLLTSVLSPLGAPRSGRSRLSSASQGEGEVHMQAQPLVITNILEP